MLLVSQLLTFDNVISVGLVVYTYLFCLGATLPHYLPTIRQPNGGLRYRGI